MNGFGRRPSRHESKLVLRNGHREHNLYFNLWDTIKIEIQILINLNIKIKNKIYIFKNYITIIIIHDFKYLSYYL
uniref:Putative ovule protein n=1 Tax=Solanum chacoense TaxID=4108 RepID=A0A0V0GZ65_SOLCH